MWIVIVAVVLMIIGFSSMDNNGLGSPSYKERKMRETKQMYTELTEELATLLDEYAKTLNHSAKENQTAWEKCNSLLQGWGINKQGPVFQVFHEVCGYLRRQIPIAMGGDENELRGFCNEFAGKLWDFYYQIAFTYDLPPADQEVLLNYLLSCFRKDGAYAHQDHSDYSVYRRIWSDINVDWDNWDAKCIALLEEGCRKNSPLAIRCLADCYYKRIGVDLKDFDKAFSLYQQAAKQGDMQAVYMLGQCYENARGTRRDYQKAGDCYMYAYSNSKNPDYSKALGRLYDGNRWDKNRYSPEIFDCSNTPVMKKENLVKLKQDMDKCLHTDLDTADLAILAVSIGMISETIIKSFIECYESVYLKADPSEQIELLRNRGYFTKEMFYQTTTVRKLRNRGAHNRDGDPITLDEIKQALHYIREIVEYYEQF